MPSPEPLPIASPPGGLGALFEQHRGELRRFLAARTGSPDEADDLLQDLWIKLDGQSTGPIANGRAYLFRMANNLVLDRVRARQRAMRRDHDWLASEDAAILDPAERADRAPNPEEAALRAEETARVRDAIAALPPGAGRALQLCRIEGMGQAEAASLLGISRSGVEKHLALAMKLLRRSLADCGLLPRTESMDKGRRKGGDGPGEPAP